MKIVHKNEIEFHPGSSQRDGFLFFYENELYRAPVGICKEIIDSLIDNYPKYLQTMSQTDILLSIHGNKIPCYKQKYYNHIALPVSLSTCQLKKLIVSMISLNIDLLQRGFVLADVHAHNMGITTDGPIYFDIGSLNYVKDYVRINSCGQSLTEFRWLVDKYLYKADLPDNMRFFYEGKSSATPIKEISKLDPKSIDTYHRLRKIISDYNPKIENSFWSNEYSKDLLTDNLMTSRKAPQLMEMLDKLDFETMTDVGCNRGYFSFYICKNKNLKSVMAIDFEEGAIITAEKENESRKLPIVFANCDISKFLGTWDAHKVRFQSDLVLALAIEHHAAKIMSIDAFIITLAGMSKRYVVLEDIDHAHGCQAVFEKLGFKLVSRVPSYPDPRTISLYEREVKMPKFEVIIPKPKIHLLWPTIRPNVFKTTHRYWISAADDSSRIVTKAAVDDKISREKLAGYDCCVIDNKRGGVGQPSYELTTTYNESRPGDILILATDDFFPPKGWDTYLFNNIGDAPCSYIVLDGIQPYGAKVITLPIVNHAAFAMLNKIIYHKDYHHLCSDLEFFFNCDQLGMIKRAPLNSQMWEHRHYSKGLRKQDSFDTANNSVFGADQQVLAARMRKPLAERLK